MKLIKNILIVFLLLSVLAIGTLTFTDTVEAAKWKKYDSGKFQNEYPMGGDKKIASYQSYLRGNNEIYVNIYSYSKKTNKKILRAKISFSKKNGIIKIVEKSYNSNEKNKYQIKTSKSVKTVYKAMMKNTIKVRSNPPNKAAFDNYTFKLNNQTVKIYSIKLDKNYINTYIYKNGEEIASASIEKNNNKVTIKKFDKKRKISNKETLKTTKSIDSVYKTFINDILKKYNSN
ncbi:MAG: hypothetical protein FWH54_01835 [Methanobrevibacter sp.]|nr:hypothetical protein [Methanobrevibacter sp.]